MAKIKEQNAGNCMHTKLSVLYIPSITSFLSFYKTFGAWIGTNQILPYPVAFIVPISHIGTFPFFFKHGMGTNLHESYTQTFLLNMSFLFSEVPVIVVGVTVSHQLLIWKSLCLLQMRELRKSLFVVNYC